MATKKTAQLKGAATQKQIDEWKAKYPLGVYFVEVGGQVAYFRNPTRTEINYALAQADPDSPLFVYEKLAEATFLEGQTNKDILADDKVYSPLMQAMKLKMDGIGGRLVNL